MKQRFALIIATWFGSGLLPPLLGKGMGGTYGSIAALPLCWLLILAIGYDSRIGLISYGITIVILLSVGLWSVKHVEAALGAQEDWRGNVRQHDQNQIVIDEVLGMVITTLPIALTGASLFFLIPALLLFRLLDLLKPQPAKMLDAMQGPAGVMLDDAVVGIYAALLMWLMLSL